MASRKKVTVIGLGHMGSALADALIRCGHQVTVWNRTSARAAELVAKGAILASSAAEAVSASPITIMCVLDYTAATAILASDGVEKAIAGKSLVQLTSALPEEAPAQHEWVRTRGGQFIAGGIMSFPKEIGRPETYFVYSGDEQAFLTHREVLQGLGGDLRYLGTDPSTSLGVYITSGLYMLGALALFLETASIAEHYGISIEQYREFALATHRVLQERVCDSADRIAADRLEGDEASIEMVTPTLTEHCRHFAHAGLKPRMIAAFVDHLQEAVAGGRGPLDIAALVRRPGFRS